MAPLKTMVENQLLLEPLAKIAKFRDFIDEKAEQIL